eukprot:Anaeramoba_ignava/c19631_g1_i1.p1 GENE.c19631_g1_i1~~c19631_g1_i1.p1  ORF type:complete len:292 (-),score=94.24 c19631_g1_i1:85-960(-)
MKKKRYVQTTAFDGVINYTCPEILKDQIMVPESYLWFLGCLIYEIFAGEFPFQGLIPLEIYRKILKKELHFPSNFPEQAKDLLFKLLVLDPEQRIGAHGDMESIKKHPFFQDINFARLPQKNPPKFRSVLPTLNDLFIHDYEKISVNINDEQQGISQENSHPELSGRKVSRTESQRINAIRAKLLREQKKKSPWAKFLNENELIVESGPTIKKKNISQKKRHLILTDLPRFIYFDSSKNEKKGEIAFTSELKIDLKDNKFFNIVTPKRTYYMEDLNEDAERWVLKKIKKIK